MAVVGERRRVERGPGLPRAGRGRAYTNSTDYHTGLIGNGWTNQFGIRLDNFEVEYSYDYLRLLNGAGLYVNMTSSASAGQIATGWRDLSFGGAQMPMDLYFHSDTTVSSSGISAGRARICHYSSNAHINTPYVMQPAERYSGSLLGKGDVVYMVVPVGSTKGRRHLLRCTRHICPIWQIRAGAGFAI